MIFKGTLLKWRSCAIATAIFAILLGGWLVVHYPSVGDRRVGLLALCYLAGFGLFSCIFERMLIFGRPRPRLQFISLGAASAAILVILGIWLADSIYPVIAMSREYPHDGALSVAQEWFLYLFAYTFVAYAALRIVLSEKVLTSPRIRMIATVTILVVMTPIVAAGFLGPP